MDNLKQLISKKKKLFTEESGGRKYAKRSELEETRLKRLREEEEAERERKVRTCAYMRTIHKFDMMILPVGSFATTEEACYCRSEGKLTCYSRGEWCEGYGGPV